jgi:phage shock protein PspC (stress-responsive transcriptional regulator)/predicted membrane protein
MSTTETQTPIKELHRSSDERIIAGVAGGLGRYFDISPTFFRIGFVILTLVGGAGILLYVAAALVIPDEGRSDSIVSEALRRHRDRPWLLAGVALVGIALVSLIAQADFWPNSGFAWTLLLLGGLAIVIAQRRSNDGSPPPETQSSAAEPRPRPPSLFLPVVGGLLAAAGALALLAAVGVDIPWDVALAVGAIATGVAVVAGAATRRRTGGLVVVGVFLATLAIAVSAIDIQLEGPIGERTYSPLLAADVHRNYEMSIGDLTVDLTNTVLDSDTEIDANVGIGSVTVVVPADAVVSVDASASAGEVTVFGRKDDGVDAHVSENSISPGALQSGTVKTIQIDTHVGLGNVSVSRIPR